MTKLSILIVSFNTKKLLNSCLDSLYKNTSQYLLKQTEIIVIDNASTDGTIDMLQKYPDIDVINNQSNYGFAKANNQGIKKAKGEWILLLNSDTVISPNALDIMLKNVTKHSFCGVAGCQLVNGDDTLQPSVGYLPALPNIFLWMSAIDDIPILKKFIPAYHINDGDFYQKEQNVGWVSGAFFFLNKNVIKNVGMLDENIFMYGEEVELSIRINKSGWKVIYFPNVKIKHLKGQSSSGSQAGIVEEFKTLKYIFQKHKPSWQFPILRNILRLGALLRIILFGIILGDRKRLHIYAKAFKVA